MTPIRVALAHAVAAGFVVIASLVFATLAYFGLLAWAVVAGEPIGGLLAFPFMLFAALTTSLASVALLILPATLLARVACSNWFPGSRLAEIPASMGFLLVLALIWALPLGSTAGWTVSISVRWATIVWFALLVPLGLYWWTVQGGDWILQQFGRGATWIFRSRTETASPPSNNRVNPTEGGSRIVT